MEKIRVAFYMRVSTVEQVDGFSLDMQEESLKDHVSRNSYKGWYTDSKWYFSEQGSGGDMDRGELKRLLKMAKNGEFDLVLVWKIDRISRSLSDLLQIFEVLDKNGVSFASVKEDIDFSGAIGKLIFQIFGALAEFERENIKLRTTEGKRMSALSGNYIGGSVPYGYEKFKNTHKKGSKLKKVESEAKIVKQIFNWFVYENKTPTQIAQKLNKMSVPKGKSVRSNAKHTKWSDVTVRGILLNEAYRGVYITNRKKIISRKPKRYAERPPNEWIINDIPNIISTAIFMDAQTKLNEGNKSRRGGGRIVYMLAGKLVDTATNKGFVGYQSSKGTRNYRRKKFTDKKGVDHKTISIAANDLEKFVWSYTEKAINQPEVFLKIHKENSDNGKRSKALIATREIHEKLCSKANGKINRVDEDYYEGNIDQEKRDELLARYTEERDYNFSKVREIDKELKALSLYSSACRDVKMFSENMKEGIKKLTYKQKADIVNMLVERIELSEEYDKRRVKVFFRFDQKVIANAIPSGRTDLVHKVNKKDAKASDILFNGGHQRKGYFLFKFERVMEYRGLNRQKMAELNKKRTNLLIQQKIK